VGPRTVDDVAQGVLDVGGREHLDVAREIELLACKESRAGSVRHPRVVVVVVVQATGLLAGGKRGIEPGVRRVSSSLG